MDSTFINNLSLEIKDAIKLHSFEKVDEEICGFILESKNNVIYFPVENNANDKKHYFSIHGKDFLKAQRLGKILAICHSHSQRKDFSSFDKKNSFGHNFPFVFYCKETDTFSDIINKECNNYSKYLNREFEIGKSDCFSLVRDFYQEELGIKILDVKRGELWNEKDVDLIIHTALKEGFKIISKESNKENFDILIFKSYNNKFPKHLGIYLGANEYLHHPRIGGSRIDRLDENESNLLYLARK